MKTMIVVMLAVSGLFQVASGQNTSSLPKALHISATGTNRTTGTIASMVLQNRGNTPLQLNLGAFFIPSDGKYQPYIVPGTGSITIAPHSSSNLSVQGYCVDIFKTPLPDGASAGFENWIHAAPLSPDWKPSPDHGWQYQPDSRALTPGTGIPLEHTLDLQKHPEEAAALLLQAYTQIEQAYSALQASGAINTPFSSQPDKERTAVIQQTLWLYCAEIMGTPYTKEDFRKNTIQTFEHSSGIRFQEKQNVEQEKMEQGIDDFWNTFEATGYEAKLIRKPADKTGRPELIDVKNGFCECGTVKMDAKVFIKFRGRDTELEHAFAMDAMSNVRDTLKGEGQVLADDEIRLEFNNLVATCTECKNGLCDATITEVKVSTNGLEQNNLVLTADNGSYTADLGKVKAIDSKNKPVENPVRIFISVKFECKGDGDTCKARNCEKVFEIQVERKP